MFWKWFRFIVLLIISGAFYYIGQVGLPYLDDPIPPLGKLVNPYTGFWQNDQKSDKIEEEVDATNLSKDVKVLWDERRVPHIFGATDSDVYFTQGYVTAQNRLWQMDFMSRVAGGRLSEVVGERAIGFDQFHRRIGLRESAEKVLSNLNDHPELLSSLEDYAAGVNAFIAELDPKEYPVEFKILNYKPEEWTPLKSALILKYMAWDLDGGTDDRMITNAKKAMPDSIFNEIYPIQNPYYQPFTQPNPATEKASQRRNTSYQQQYNNEFRQRNTSSIINDKKLGLPSFITEADHDYQKGSNNWVVNGSRTRSGLPILANDPHLSLSLPSLWFETQLSSNEGLNVYGVALPGIPMIVIGFNQNVAWGLTYTTSDPIDFNYIDFNEDRSQYKLDSTWVNSRVRIDTVFVKDAKPVIENTYITTAGPVIYNDSIPRAGYNSRIPDANVAMNWTAHNPTLEMKTIYLLNRAKNIDDYKAALPYFAAPGQNFVFASNTNDIAIWHTGKFPIRSADQARFVGDSLKTSSLWKEFIPFDELPHSINPKEGFIFSANASPVGDNYKYYLGAEDYASFERSNRIYEVLDSLKTITAFDFQKLQLDNYSVLAEKLLPYLLTRLSENSLSNTDKDSYNELANWDYQFNAISKAPPIFNAWVSEIQSGIWKDEGKEINDSWMYPRIDVTTKLILTDSTSIFYDDKSTKKIESLDDIILQSFQNAVSGLTDNYGSLNESWKWGKYNPTTVNSLANLPGFGSKELMTGGSKRSVNAISGSHGPSWRMIVELGKTPKAYGVYPGGQSGNPGSSNYDDFVDDWAQGDYFELLFLLNENETDLIKSTTILKAEE